MAAIYPLCQSKYFYETLTLRHLLIFTRRAELWNLLTWRDVPTATQQLQYLMHVCGDEFSLVYWSTSYMTSMGCEADKNMNYRYAISLMVSHYESWLMLCVWCLSECSQVHTESSRAAKEICLSKSRYKSRTAPLRIRSLVFKLQKWKLCNTYCTQSISTWGTICFLFEGSTATGKTPVKQAFRRIDCDKTAEVSLSLTFTIMVISVKMSFLPSMQRLKKLSQYVPPTSSPLEFVRG